MKAHRLIMKSGLVAALALAALAIHPRAGVVVTQGANTSCIEGCCVCGYPGETCWGVDAWDTCMEACGVPPSSCVENDVWDCGQDVIMVGCS